MSQVGFNKVAGNLFFILRDFIIDLETLLKLSDMETMTFKSRNMDLTKVQIMSRGIEVDKAWMDSYRIRYIYNRIESVDMSGLDSIELHRVIRDRMEVGSKILLGRVISNRGNCMMVEGGLKDVAGGQVVVTTIFHFEDVYSMEMFIMRYPHKMWDHMKDLYIMMN